MPSVFREETNPERLSPCSGLPSLGGSGLQVTPCLSACWASTLFHPPPAVGTGHTGALHLPGAALQPCITLVQSKFQSPLESLRLFFFISDGSPFGSISQYFGAKVSFCLVSEDLDMAFFHTLGRIFNDQ